MKIKYFWALLILTFYVCALNFILFNSVIKGLANVENPVLLGVILFIGIFAILFASLLILALPRIFKITASLFIIICTLSSYFMHSYGVFLDTDMLANALATDTREAFSYINLSFLLWIFLLAILPLCLLWTLKIQYSKGFFATLWRNFALAFCLLGVVGGLVYANSQSVIPFFRNNSDIKSLHLPFYPLISLIRVSVDKLDGDQPFTDISAGFTRQELAPNEKPRFLVFVLGETARAQNYSALGYATNDTNAYTKPFVESGNAQYFEMSSCGTATLLSVPCMFSHLDRQNYDAKVLAQNAIDILTINGIPSLWLDNNSGGCKGVCLFTKNQHFSKTYDGEILPILKEHIANTKGESALFFHIQGSHGPTYYQRYPDEFKRFLPTCDTSDLAKCDEQSIVNTYDNTILYTDFLLAELIKELEKRSDIEGSLIYISDHGESLGEGGIYLHGLPYAIAPQVQKSVPFLFYSTNKEKVATIKQNTDFSHDFIFHTLLGFFDITGGIYDKNLDIFGK